AAKEHVCASTQANSDICGNTDVFAGQRPGRNTGCRGEYSPGQLASRAEADIQTDRIEGAVIGLGWQLAERSRGLIVDTLQRLMTDNNKTKVRSKSAGKRPRLCPGLGRGRCRKRRAERECHEQQTDTRLDRPFLEWISVHTVSLAVDNHPADDLGHCVQGLL